MTVENFKINPSRITQEYQWGKDIGIYYTNEKGNVIATGSLSLENEERQTEVHSFIYGVTVIEEYRGKGIGTLLIKELENISLEYGRNSVQLETEAGATVSAWYESMGYEKLEEYTSGSGDYWLYGKL